MSIVSHSLLHNELDKHVLQCSGEVRISLHCRHVEGPQQMVNIAVVVAVFSAYFRLSCLQQDVRRASQDIDCLSFVGLSAKNTFIEAVTTVHFQQSSSNFTKHFCHTGQSCLIISRSICHYNCSYCPEFSLNANFSLLVTFWLFELTVCFISYRSCSFNTANCSLVF